MAKELPDYMPVPLPNVPSLLKRCSKEYIVEQLLRLIHRFDQFYYKETHDNNDLREAHLKFLSDADQFKEWLKEITADILELYDVYDKLRDFSIKMQTISKMYATRINKARLTAEELGIDLLDPLKQPNDIKETVEKEAKDLLRRKKNMEEMEKEIAISEAMLQKKKSEMELALQSRYTLSDMQKKIMIEEKDLILDGIEEWGTITGALKHNPKITSKASTIMMYCQQFPEFGQAIEVSKTIFKDRVDSTLIDRAIEGTENPQFFKGEHVGNYKIKNDKLMLEIAKAKLPEQYNKKSTENTKAQQVNNISITSFANINEADLGFKKDVGVVYDVDDTGKVERITTEDSSVADKMERLKQQEKMLAFYKKKEGALIIDQDTIDGQEEGNGEEIIDK